MFHEVIFLSRHVLRGKSSCGIVSTSEFLLYQAILTPGLSSYDGGAGEHRSMADARIKAEHQAKRKMLAHLSAQKTIAGLEPVINDTTAILVTQVHKHIASGRSMNMRRYLNYYTIDLFSELLYGHTLGCLERGNDIVEAETPDGKVYKVPFIKSLHDATVINTILGMEAPLLSLTKKIFSWHPYKKSGANYDNITYHKTKHRYRETDSEDDIFSKTAAEEQRRRSQHPRRRSLG
jgi:cytochrome P450